MPTSWTTSTFTDPLRETSQRDGADGAAVVFAIGEELEKKGEGLVRVFGDGLIVLQFRRFQLQFLEHKRQFRIRGRHTAQADLHIAVEIGLVPDDGKNEVGRM